MISERIKNTIAPPLVELGLLANSTAGTISLGQGVPYYQPDEKYLTEVFSNVNRSEFHRYTQDPGIIELREEICKKIHLDFGVNTGSDTITVTNGANQAYVNSILTITDPGDKIGLITPYYFNHQMAATFANVDCVEINLNIDYTLSQENIETAISQGVKAIVLVNPGNPTGSVHSESDLRLLADLTEDKEIWIISDETYEYFTYDRKFIPMSSINKIRDRLVSITSFSKTYGIPGWRIGYYYASKEFTEEAMKVQDTTTICAPAVAQYLGLHLLQKRHEIIPEYVGLMKKNHSVAKDLLEEVSWLEAENGQGAYYLFPKQTTGRLTSELAKELITDHKIALVPGGVFGSSYEDHFRISFANVKEEQLKEAFSRLKNAHQ
ncbi:MAG: pyridoxal phosphate-dependent aminotransferase [Candidatus Kariarchaeaceae archaeon]|jgi:aspartate/methionine/tyrosine aminotransferase